MINQTQIQRRVIETIARQYQDSPVFQEEMRITAETSIRDELEFDSLMMVVLQIEIEDAFHIQFDAAAEDMQMVFSDVGTLCNAVHKHLSSQL